MPSRARERQLAKQHAKRQAERGRAARRKRIGAGLVGAVVGIAAIVIGIAIVSGGNEPQASGTPTVAPTSSPSGGSSSPVGQAGLPQRTGQVVPQAEPPATVACGGAVPKTAEEPRGQYDAAPKPEKVLDETATYTATVVTSCGAFELSLDAEHAPATVASFAFLAREGFFDGQTFHRIIPGFVVQGGDPLGTGSGGPGYQFADEISPDIVFDHAGQLAMANSGPGTNGSQFFVTLGGAEAAGHLNGLHTIFGEVTSGMDVIDRIAAVGDASTGAPSEAVYIESVTVHEQPGAESSPPG